MSHYNAHGWSIESPSEIWLEGAEIRPESAVSRGRAFIVYADYSGRMSRTSPANAMRKCITIRHGCLPSESVSLDSIRSVWANAPCPRHQLLIGFRLSPQDFEELRSTLLAVS